MQIKAFADAERLGFDSWNQAIGNKILHLFFVIRLAETHGFQPVVPVDSNVDNVFEFKNGLKTLNTREYLTSLGYLYQEETAFNVDSPEAAVKESARQLRQHLDFLNSPKATKDFAVKGHYWHYSLMPSVSMVNKWLKLKDSNLEHLLTKYPTIVADNAVAVHLRDTDFADALKNVFPQGLLLPDDYYRAAITSVEKRIGSNVEYHLFSDNIPRLKKIFEGKSIVVHDDPYYIDWTALFVMRRIISSNSSFAWVASLFNKELVVQPFGGLNYWRHELGPVPTDFKIPNSIQINKNGKEAETIV